MGERKWTSEQLSAIEERSKTLLVSAAAGSGKTATLTERIIRSLTDPERPIGVESLLVVTFTNAATAELRAKLTRALEDAVARNPSDKRLEHQLYMLPSAKIRTIDSFCNDVLRSATDRVGISPGYRIIDGAENELLASSILEGMINAIYNGELAEVALAEEFEELADCLTDSRRTEDLSEIFRYVYTKCESSEYGVDVLLPLIEYYNTENFTSVEKTKHGSYLMEITDEQLEHYATSVGKIAAAMAGGNDSEKILSAFAYAECDMLLSILEKKTYRERREAFVSLSFARKPTVKRGQGTDLTETYSELRDMMREDLKASASYFAYTEEGWRELLSGLYRLMTLLYRFLSHFDRLFLDEKRRRAAFSYADIERLCYAALIKDGERTDIADNLRAQFDAIYIDEYQDVNSLQNSIFEAISRPDNRFMVGDIKQSIYGFRHARPEIFAKLKASYPPLGSSEGSEASIFMSKNFRCDRGIVDFVNGIFDKTFSLLGESIGYEPGDRLEYAKIHDTGEPEYKKPELCMLDDRSRLSEEVRDEIGGADEAEVVAAKIKELLDRGKLDSGAPIKPSDIAIILRNARGKDVLYAEALSRLSIPSVISGSKSFFLSPEVLLALCLLNSIDNPGKDIYLAGLMCSPLFSFDADDLYIIRSTGTGETLYESLVSYVSEHPDFERGKYFLDTLSYYRTIAEGVGVDTLIFKLYRETALLALAEKNGAADNLMLLYDYARGYEAGAYRGLYNFISFINSVIDKKTSFDDNRELSGEDAVRIVTAHASKGLEYPVVFLVGAGTPPSSGDVRPRLVLSNDLGISFRLRTPSGLAIVDSPVHDLICHSIKRKNYEEELRVLYVALTRAREQLYVVGTSTSSKREEYLAKMRVKRDTLSPYVMRSLRSYLEIMLVAGECPEPLTPEEFAGVSRDFPQSAEQACDMEDEGFEFADLKEADPTLADTLTERFTYVYPDGHMTVLPEKLSVSRAYPTLLDEDDEAVVMFEEEEEKKQHAPAFISGVAAEESAKRGIATHYFMQFCDLEGLKERGADAELKRLVSEGYISPADGERVRIREIEAFCRSELFSDMLSAKSLHRELRFNVRLPASVLTENEDRKKLYGDSSVLVQGVIDCIVEYPDGTLGLFDYKTDRLSPEERADRSLAEATLKRKHSTQLSYYAMAVREMFGKEPKRVEVYSLALGRLVDVKI